MEFMDKRKRIVLLSIAKEGVAGITLDSLNSTLSLLMSKDTLAKSIEELYFSQYISLVRDGDEIRYVATKRVRNAMISLELHKFRISKCLEELKKVSEVQMEAKERLSEMSKVVDKGLRIIATAYLNLLSEEPEFTIPEFSEVVQIIYSEILSRLLPLVEKDRTQEELEKLVELVSKYMGEKEAKTLKTLLEKAKHNA